MGRSESQECRRELLCPTDREIVVYPTVKKPWYLRPADAL
jgi:hypothetical protein